MSRYRISSSDRSVVFEHECLVGRGPDCDLWLRNARFASRHHLRLTVCALGVVVTDLQSRNGVRIDGDPIDGSQLVVGTHRIHVGEEELRLELLEAGQSVPARAPEKETTPEPYAAVGSTAT